MINFGMLMTWLSSFGMYSGLVSQCMVLYLFLITNPLGLDGFWWFVIAIFCAPCLLVFHVKVVLPQLLKYGWEKNPAYQELIREVKKCRRG